MVLNIQGI